MAEESFDTIFGSCVLDIVTPDTSVSFPEGVVDDWLTSIQKPHAERKQAFFDEQLSLSLVMHIKHPSLNGPHDCHSPPRSLVDFLSHIQVSLEASYISSTPNRDAPDNVALARPRTSSMLKGRPVSLHPSIFPPNTPNPIPSTTESDRKYVQSEGTLLFSSIWGARKEESKEKFALLYSKTQKCWIAVYAFSLIVSYLRLPFSDPLLCLTASATLRERPLSFSQTTHPLIAYLARAGLISHSDSGAVADDEDGEEDEEDEETGFEEINLFEGLSLVGSSISSDSEPLRLPSTRLGNSTRQRHFSLPPVSLPTRTPPSISKQGLNNILRISYRRILQTASGFRVRMRTVFVPHVLLPKNFASEKGQDVHDRNDFESGNEEREAGNSERTVVLCVEVENSGESGPATGFALERLSVKIGGEGATARLIGWGNGAFNPDIENHLFPLLIGSMEQYNLLYVVSFWNTPNDQDNLLLNGRDTNEGSELQRAVTITIYGRPYLTSEVKDENNILSYPTQTFSSRWNCILDLSSRPRDEPIDFHETLVGRSALPEPPSPFPGRTALSSLNSSPPPKTTIPQAIAGKRHTLPGNITALRAINPSTNFRLSLPSREYPGGSAAPPAPATGFTPPSVALQAFNRPASAMFGTAPPPPTGGAGFIVGASPPEIPAQPFVAPPTPAYPASSPGVAANAPQVQALGSQHGYSGPSIEIKRERGAGMMAAVPQTPLPTVLNTQFDARREPLPVPSGEPIIVSVGLLADGPDDDCPFGQRKIYPSDQFTLDIFVYNQSSWTRRFEVSYPDADRRQWRTDQSGVAPRSRRKDDLEEVTGVITLPSILPLQNRVRVGPLKPSTCQSVRMDFLAISPGVHSVDILTLTDIETGYLVNLRSVVDIVVHERAVKEMGNDRVP